MKLLQALVLIALPCALTSQTTIEDTFLHDGIDREYILYLPAGLSENAPLVFNLHGYSSNNEQQRSYSEMDAEADEEFFAVCYPLGTEDENNNPHWNSELDGADVDDVGFLVALAEYLQETHGLDPEHTFSCGMSNGGFMSYALACEAWDTFKGIASVTGSMTENVFNSCDPDTPVPVLDIAGTNDLLVNYDGLDGNYAGMEDVIDLWVDKHGCTDLLTFDLPDVNTLDNSTVTVFRHQPCDSGGRVWLYRVNGGGHTWPGAFPTIILGPTNQDFHASDLIWYFFSQADSPNGVSETEKERVVLYPNPAIATFSIDSEWKQLMVVDPFGKVVLETDYRSEVDVSLLPIGLYFVWVDDQVVKLVKD